ncbi:hypothetical protein DNF23_47270 [Pseudomonas syringae pv. pisi]
MKRPKIFSKGRSSTSSFPLKKSPDDANGFSYFKDDTAAIKLFAWIILSAEHVMIAGLRTVSHVAVLGFAVFAGRNYSEGIKTMLAKLLSL